MSPGSSRFDPLGAYATDPVEARLRRRKKDMGDPLRGTGPGSHRRSRENHRDPCELVERARFVSTSKKSREAIPNLDAIREIRRTSSPSSPVESFRSVPDLRVRNRRTSLLVDGTDSLGAGRAEKPIHIACRKAHPCLLVREKKASILCVDRAGMSSRRIRGDTTWLRRMLSRSVRHRPRRGSQPTLFLPFTATIRK